MRVVLDTNVLVSGLLNPFGNCGELVRLLTSDQLTLCVDARILFEYRDGLHRPRFGFEPRQIDTLMEYIEHTAEQCPARSLKDSLPDPDDDMFLEVALAGKADFVITGNLKHFPEEFLSGIVVVSPREFLEAFRSRE